MSGTIPEILYKERDPLTVEYHNEKHATKRPTKASYITARIRLKHDPSTTIAPPQKYINQKLKYRTCREDTAPQTLTWNRLKECPLTPDSNNSYTAPVNKFSHGFKFMCSTSNSRLHFWISDCPPSLLWLWPKAWEYPNFNYLRNALDSCVNL